MTDQTEKKSDGGLSYCPSKYGFRQRKIYVCFKHGSPQRRTYICTRLNIFSGRFRVFSQAHRAARHPMNFLLPSAYHQTARSLSRSAVPQRCAKPSVFTTRDTQRWFLQSRSHARCDTISRIAKTFTAPVITVGSNLSQDPYDESFGLDDVYVWVR